MWLVCSYSGFCFGTVEVEEGSDIQEAFTISSGQEYQREQLKQELKGELYSELSDKLDEDVAVATETLRKATEAKVASESKKLQNQAKTHQQRLTANAKALAAQLSADANSRAVRIIKAARCCSQGNNRAR